MEEHVKIYLALSNVIAHMRRATEVNYAQQEVSKEYKQLSNDNGSMKN